MIVIPISGLFLGILLELFVPFIMAEAIEQLFFTLLPIIGVIIIIVSNALLFAGLRETKSVLFKIFCLLIFLFEILFLSYKFYKEVYITYIIKVPLEIKNESSTENIFAIQVKYKNEKSWQTVYIENQSDKQEKIQVRGAPFSVRIVTYPKENSPKDRSKRKFLTYYQKKFIQIPKKEKCSLTYKNNNLHIDEDNFIFDDSPLFDFNVLVYLQPSNSTNIYRYSMLGLNSKKEYTIKSFELISKDFLFSDDFPQNVYCYKDSLSSSHLKIDSSKSINENGKTVYNIRPFDNSMPHGIFEYKLLEPIKIIDTGTKMYISKEKPNFYRFEVK